MTTRDAITIVREYFRKCLCADPARIYDYVHESFSGNVSGRDRDSLKKVIVDMLKAYPGLDVDIVKIFAVDDQVALHAAFHQNGKSIMRMTAIFRLEDGLIIESWTNSDSFV
ncbi:MAG: nuclear transport factor 2 family protein [Myxococcales bacterium]|nr:nuclear transport factor 2 family protein [Myxococcales bacterium]